MPVIQALQNTVRFEKARQSFAFTEKIIIFIHCLFRYKPNYSYMCVGTTGDFLEWPFFFQFKYLGNVKLM